MSFQQRALAKGALGFYFVEDGGRMVIVAPWARIADVSGLDADEVGVRVSIKASQVDPQALGSTRQALRDLMNQSAYQYESMSMQFDSAAEKLVVTSSIDPLVLSRELGSSWRLVDYRYGTSELLTGRSNDSSPFSGGAKIKFDGFDSSTFCTSGFSVTNGSERAMLIPAHCGNVNTTVRTYAGGVDIGKTGTDRHCGPINQGGDNSDFQFVRGKSYTDNIYLGGDPGFLSDIMEYGTPALGSAYRFSGAVTHETAPVQVVSDLDAEFWIEPYTPPCTDSGWWQTHVIAFSSDTVCDAVPGDSGAPFFARQGTNPVSVRLRGMVIGREVVGGAVKAHCYAVKLSNIASLSGYWPITTN